MKKIKMQNGIHIIFIILIIIANLYVMNLNLTNSKYVFESDGAITGEIADWNIKLKYNSGDYITNTYNINLVGSNAKIMPGSEGSFTLTIDTTDCDENIPIEYEIKLSNKSNVPSNMDFWIMNSETKNIINTTSFTKRVLGGTTNTETINWKWNLTDGIEDTYQNQNLSLVIEVSAYSVQSLT